MTTGAPAVAARAPGRVNLIGDHTDYTGGLCFPMAIDRHIDIAGSPAAGVVRLTTPGEPDAVVPLDVTDPAAQSPEWARYVAGVVGQLRPSVGFAGTVTSTLPAGAGLSSSAALEVAVALVLGADDTDPVALARLCQAAEHAARGVPTGLLDQLACIGGVAGHGLLIDCQALTTTPVPLPPADEAEWLVVFTGARSLAASQYTTRVAELAAVEQEIGPVRAASADDVAGLRDPVLRSRARHVVSENARVAAFAESIAAGDVVAAGALMSDSHRSLRDDYQSSAPHVDVLCARLDATPGVLGSRITGGGWGGAVVALTRPGAVDATAVAAVAGTGTRHDAAAWYVHPSPGAHLLDHPEN